MAITCSVCGHECAAVKVRNDWKRARVLLVRQLRRNGYTIREVAKELNLSLSQTHYWVNKARELAEQEDAV